MKIPVRPVIVLVLSLASPALSFGSSRRIAGIAIGRDDVVYCWFREDSVVTTGTPRCFERRTHAEPFTVHGGETVQDIVAMAIGPDDKVYSWYRDGRRSSGTPRNLGSTLKTFKTAGDKGPTDIVGIGIAKDGRVFAWYTDLTFSIGTPDNLGKFQESASYSLPSGQIPGNVVEIDIARSNNRVYAWYRNGFGSSGDAHHLDSTVGSFGWIPSTVLYHWWGVSPWGHVPRSGTVPGGDGAVLNLKPASAVELELPDAPTLEADNDDEARRGHHAPHGQQPPDPGETGGNPEPATPKISPPPDGTPFTTGLGTTDCSIAVGKDNIIVTTTGNIAFFDKKGNPLTDSNGSALTFKTKTFFERFLAAQNDDGSFNEANLNLYMDLPKPCDSPDWPQLDVGTGLCLSQFNDARVTYDRHSGRFFVVSHVRHRVYEGGVKGTTACSRIVLSDLASAKNQGYTKCDATTTSPQTCSVNDDRFCHLPRRYYMFAVSVSEDPRDGFHQYAMTESIYRDWPWQSIVGDRYVVAGNHKTADPGTPVATVFSVAAIGRGERHPPHFNYSEDDVAGVRYVQPVAQHVQTPGLTYLLGASGGRRLDIFAFLQSRDPWKKAPLEHASVELDSDLPRLTNATFRNDLLYLVGNETVPATSMLYVHLFRIPVGPVAGGPAIGVSKRASTGFLDETFGRRTPSDPPGALYSYDNPAVTVNADGHMLFGYCRRPFPNGPPLQPEARYSVWYSGENVIRPSRQLQAGQAADDGSTTFDFVTATVDPDDKTFWVALPFMQSFTKGPSFRMVVGKITP